MSDAAPVSGSCGCQRIRFEVTPPSKFHAHCHCNNCRRAHGAAFVTWAGFLPAQFRLVSGENDLRRWKTDTEATRSFCGTCGTTLFFESPRWAGEIHVATATLEAELDQPPQAHVYVDHKADWWAITDGLKQFGGEDGTTPKE